MFLDVWASYKDPAYLFFSTFSTYMFLITALAYIPIVHDMSLAMRKAHALESSEEANRIAKHYKYRQISVISLVVFCIASFLIDYFIEVHKSVN